MNSDKEGGGVAAGIPVTIKDYIDQILRIKMKTLKLSLNRSYNQASIQDVRIVVEYVLIKRWAKMMRKRCLMTLQNF